MTKGTPKNLSRSPARPGVEALEDRQLLNGKSLLSLVDLLPVHSTAPALVQTTLPLVHTNVSASVGGSKDKGSLVSNGLHLGEAKGPHAVDASTGKKGTDLTSDNKGAHLGGKSHGPSHPPSPAGQRNSVLSHEGTSPGSDPGDNNSNAGSAESSVLSVPGPRSGPQPGGPPASFLPPIVLPSRHLPGVPEENPPPSDLTASSLVMVPVVRPAEDLEGPILLPRFYASGISDQTGNAFWAEFLPERLSGPEGTLAAVAVGSEGSAEPRTDSPEAVAEMPEAGLLGAELPHGAGLGADLERLLDELNDLGSGIKDAVARSQLAFWLMAGSVAVVGCEVARRRAREQTGLTAADLRWFPELAAPVG